MSVDTDLAWCAGFFDGEGCAKFYRSIPNPKTGAVSPQLLVSVSQNTDNIETLEFFQSVTGLGEMNGPYKTNTGMKNILCFGVKEVEKLLALLRPYLKTKKTTDFQIALASYWMHDPKPTQEDRDRATKRSKKKGCANCGEKWDGMFCMKCGYMR